MRLARTLIPRVGTVSLALALVLVLLASSRADRSAAQGRALFTPVADAPAGPPEGIASTRERSVRADLDLLLGAEDARGRRTEAADRVLLNLFDDATYPVLRDGLVRTEGGGTVWTGHVAGHPETVVNLSVQDDALVGSVQLPGQVYELRQAGAGVQVVREHGADLPADAEPIPIFAAPAGDESAEHDGVASTDATDAAEDDGSTIDLLVVWTPAARSAQGGTAAMEALINLAVVETNQAYANSGIAPRVSLAHMEEVAYTESGNFSTDLSRLRSTSDGYMDGVHALRDAHAADQVTLINNSTQYCGIAYLMSTVSSGFASSAFSVVYRGCATGYYSFGHEIGHNQGSHHDRGNAGSQPAYPYSYGFQDPSGAFRTIMAYNCSGGCSRVQHFSNPDVTYGGAPTGIDYEEAPASAADNARSIDETAYTFANFRVSAPETPPAAPSGLTVEGTTSLSVSLSWTDNAGNEDVFELQRSDDGQSSWSLVATLGAGTVMHTDTGLTPSSAYAYRVRAVNGGGASAYSNVAEATTDAPPPYVDQVATGEQAGAGSVSGGYGDTHADDGVAQAITERESGGPKPRRHSYLEHTWTISVQPGNTVTLFAQAWAPASTDGDAFTLSYSTDGASFQEMATIVDTADGGSPLSYALPPSTSGTVWVRVSDTDQGEGNNALDTVFVDHLYIRSESQPGSPPGAPTGLTANAESSSRIVLDWTDGSTDEYGFEIERSADGAGWTALTSVGADVTSYADESVGPNQTWHYRVRAFNGAGASAFSNAAQASTPDGIQLSGSGYKVKGEQHVDLSWSGTAGGQVDILRDGQVVATVSDQGAYTDPIGAKGGGSYDYQVCDAGSASCSNEITISF